MQSLDPYDAVVFGSAVYMKRWCGDARHFLKKHRKPLRNVPVWVFSTGPIGDPANDNPAWAEPPKIIAQIEELGGRGHVLLGGRLPAEPKTSSSARWSKAPAARPRPPRLGQIRDCAHQIASDLTAAHV